ncbi:MAG: MFS transporter [Phycisphaerales bacterium]|nr:MFS transporter [Phycisphaerales bacterium]
MTKQPQRWRKIEAHGPGHPLAWVIWSVPAFFFLYEFILRIAPSLILPDLEKSMNISAGGIGAALGAYYYAYAPMQLVVGVLLDRFGSRKLLTIAAMICVIGLAIGAGVTHAAGLAASRFLLGLGSASAYIGAVYVAMTWFPHRRMAMLTGLTAGVGFAGAIGGEFLLQEIFGSPPEWARGMWILAAAGVVITIAIWIAVPERPVWHLERTGRDKPHDLRSVLHGLRAIAFHGPTWLVSLGCSLMYIPLAFAGNWGPRDLHSVLGIPVDQAPRMYALFYVGIGIGCPLVGWLSDRTGTRKPFLVIGSLFAALGTFLMALLPESASDWAWVVLPAWGLVVSTYVLGYPLAAELNRKDAAGTAIAFVNFVGMLVAGLIVWLFGVFIDAIASNRGHDEPVGSDFRWGMGILAGIMVLAVIAHLLVRTPLEASDSER